MHCPSPGSDLLGQKDQLCVKAVTSLQRLKKQRDCLLGLNISLWTRMPESRQVLWRHLISNNEEWEAAYREEEVKKLARLLQK